MGDPNPKKQKKKPSPPKAAAPMEVFAAKPGGKPAPKAPMAKKK